ncbi:Uncharacterised protein [Mycobacteroides abscessus subsp. abscessus]|nr:Uncharacterised protein [Mycobacteroides abscessus subsp. abscessus]
MTTTASINSSPCHMWSSKMRVSGVGVTWSSTSNQSSNRTCRQWRQIQPNSFLPSGIGRRSIPGR